VRYSSEPVWTYSQYRYATATLRYGHTRRSILQYDFEIAGENHETITIVVKVEACGVTGYSTVVIFILAKLAPCPRNCNLIQRMKITETN
jgi:hypothetical protein